MTSQPQLASVPAVRNARVPKMFDVADLFPEVPNIAVLPVRQLKGFAEPGPGVPERVPGFIHSRAMIAKYLAFLGSKWSMLTLIGPTGCGKTESILDIHARANMPLLHDAATEDMKLWHMVGDREVIGGDTKFSPKKLYKAMKYGYPYLIDEVYRLSPTITSKLHMIRDRGELSIDETGETLKAAPGFKFIMTANQGGFGDFTGAYAGDSVQDAAFLNGSMVIKCDYPAVEVERKIVLQTLLRFHPSFDPVVAEDYAEKMVSVAGSARKVFVGNDDATKDRIEIPFSTRNLVMWAEFFVKFRGISEGVHPLYDALDFVCLDRACAATRATIDGFVLSHFGKKRDDVAAGV